MSSDPAMERLHPSIPSVLSRRQVMTGAAGLTFAVALARIDEAVAPAPAAEWPAGR
jgi:hypothetical protein